MRLSPLLLALLGLSACGPKEEAPPELTLSTDALDFGAVGVGSDAPLEMVLTNAGGGTVELLSVSLIEGQSSIFDVERDAVDALGAGESTTVVVTFSPFDERPYEGRIQVRSDDPANGDLYVALTGEGAPSTLDEDGDGWSAATGDCNDADPDVSPSADEVCDGRDTDCDGTTPPDEADADYDGWLVCEGDCNDGDATIHPEAEELCDDADTDCDGVEADRDDVDGDGYSICDGDCADAEPLAHPGRAEECDGIDNDCSGRPDDIDEDRDGHSPCGSAGDCDDQDPEAFPVVVDDGATGKMDGTEEHPYDSIDTALDNLDRVCRTIQLNPGVYTVALTWPSGRLTIGGAGRDAAAIVVTPAKGQRAFDVSGTGDLTLAGLTLTGAATNGDGGAARVVGGSLTLDGVIATDNTCTGDGGAVAMSSGALTILDSTFARNRADDDGGAVSVLSGDLVDSGSVYEDNSAVRGGALLVEASTVLLADLVVSGNEAADQGGGIELLGGSGSLVERVELSLNRAGSSGGGLSVVDLDDAGTVVRNLVVADNVAGVAGGGVSITGTAAGMVFANNTLVSNEAPGEGGGLFVDAGDTSELWVWSNIVAWSGGRSGVHSAGGGASFGYNLGYASASGTELDLGAGEDAGGNLTDDPELRDFSNDGDPSNDDLDLAASSPAVNSGPAEGEGPAAYADQWPDRDGTRNDRGHTGGQGASR